MASTPLTHEQAVSRLKHVKLKHLEPYAGNTRAHWKVQCSVCGHKSTKTLKQVNEAIRTNKGSCIPCGRKARSETMQATGQHRATCTLTDPTTGEKCTKPHKGKGMCQSHWAKDQKYGDPFADGVEIFASKCRNSVEEVRELLASIGHTMIGEYINTKTPVLCRHTCGEINLVNVNNVKQGAVTIGCSACGRDNGQVFDGRGYTKHPTMVYLLKHSKLGALKVGITKNESRRIHQHERSGFKLVKTWQFSTGADAYKVEQEVLRHWHEDLNCPKDGYIPKEAIVASSAGHTETVSMRKVGMRKTIQMIDELAKAR